MYDYLVVGAGLFGSIFAYEANKKGEKSFSHRQEKSYSGKHLLGKCRWYKCA